MSSGVRVIQLSPSTTNVPQGMSLEQWRTTLTAAANAWNVPCAAIRIEVGEPVQWWRANEDGRNLVAFRRESWCHNEQCGARGAFPLRAMGMTTTYPEGARGAAVREADIELNGKFFDFVVSDAAGLPAAGTGPRIPLEPVLVHELGHVLGLRDVCIDEHVLGPKVDRECPAVERASVMFAPALLPRPTERDIAGLCAIYPVNLAPHAEAADGGQGASNGIQSHAAALIALGFAMVGMVAFLRRRFA